MAPPTWQLVPVPQEEVEKTGPKICAPLERGNVAVALSSSPMRIVGLSFQIKAFRCRGTFGPTSCWTATLTATLSRWAPRWNVTTSRWRSIGASV